MTTDDVIAGVFVMHFGGAGEQSDRYHERRFGIFIKFLDLQLLLAQSPVPDPQVDI